MNRAVQVFLGGLLMVPGSWAPQVRGQDVSAIFLLKAAWYEQDTAGTIAAGTLVADTVYRARLSFSRYTRWSSGPTPETDSGFEAYNSILLNAAS